MGMLIISVFVIAGVAFISDLNTNYDLDMSTDDFNATYNRIDEVYNLTKDINDRSLKAEIPTENTWETIVKAPYTAIRFITDLFPLYGIMIQELADAFNIPKTYVNVGFVALMLTIIFSIMFFVMKIATG